MEITFTPDELRVIEFALENDIAIVVQDDSYDKKELRNLKTALKKVQGAIDGQDI